MSQKVAKYIAEVTDKYKTGRAGEHAYRPTFEKLIQSIDQKLVVTNDPKRTEYGAPDFVFTRGDLIAGYTETKDIDADLDKVEKSEQVKRYLGYSNLILTNYLEFRFFRNGERYGESIVIGKIANGVIRVQEESFNLLENTIVDFLTAKPEAIKSGERLAKIMGGKARRIRDNVKIFLERESVSNKELFGVYETVKKLLVHDLTLEKFSDMYAQTLVYGLFVARYHDDSPEKFTRAKARDLVPASNPFLGEFFDHIAGRNFEKRLGYIVDELCEVFSCADVKELMSQYFKEDLLGETHEGPDPVIHFYEDFLKEYDSDLRKKMGAYYTPLPVVRFIVRSVDMLLQKEFKLPNGLADTTKTGSVHKVQILDPAVGTGTFLSEIVQNIYQKFSTTQEGRWTTYVHHDLLPRLHGFELMMAPYTIAHLKLSMKLAETGFTIFNKGKRLGIYLTNSLERGDIQENLFTGFGFAESIAEESKEASVIKNEKPIMVVIGNPPYSVSSSNKGEWIQELIQAYKTGLVGEKNIQPLSDDYIKFIRFAEHFIEKNGSGIVAMITNNSFLDGRIHRQMRKYLLETFDSIYILDLHGSLKKGEKAPDKSKDENVFDIQQGVSISIFIRKTGDKKGFGVVYHSELYGKREDKFKALNENDLQTIEWKKLDYSEPYYFFVLKNFEASEDYEKGFSIGELFKKSSMGIATARDEQIIKFKRSDIEKLVEDFVQLGKEEFLRKNTFPKETDDWRYDNAKNDLPNTYVSPISYRPFDERWTIYSGNASGVMSRPRGEVMNNFLQNNLGLNLCKNIRKQYDPIFVSRHISDKSLLSSLDNSYLFPLYLYADDGTKVPNIKKEIIDEIEKIVGEVSPEDIFDYIYAVLHSPSYREKYKEFLKIDFPRVPYPKDVKSFQKLVALGAELRSLHLLESPKVNQFVTTYPKDGSNVVEKVEYKDGKVFINAEQYFGNVPEVAWNFYIGGYQPAQKWLKDRRGRVLTNEDIEHYQKMIVALVETDIIMKKIDKL